MNDFIERFIANIQLASNNYLRELLEQGLQNDLEVKKRELNQLLIAYANTLNDSIRMNILKTQGSITTIEHLLTTIRTPRKGKPNE